MNALAGTWYVDPKAAGTNNGMSWANAWTSFGAINWGLINPGDTLFISGGSTSQTYATPLVIGKSGTAGSPITIRIGQDAGHNGTAIFDGVGGTSLMINFGSNQYVTLDGQYNGARHMVVQNNAGTGDNPLIYGSGSQGNFLAGNKITYVEVKSSGSGIQMHYSGGAAPFELSNSYIHDIRCEVGLDMDGAQNNVAGNLYDTGALIHDNIFQVNNQGANNGNGPDAIQCTSGCSVYNNSISGATGTMSCAQHQDGVQIGGVYYKIYNNSFYCLANADIESDWYNGGYAHIWNNTFAECQQQSSSHGIEMAERSGPVNDFLVYNNTFADFTGYTAIGLHFDVSTATVSNTAIKNNIFYNNHWAVYMDNAAYNCGADVVIDSNNINAGSGGGTSIICDNVIYTSTNVQSGAPVFASYSQYSASNDYHLQASSVADIGHGITLGSPYDVDKDGRSRGTSWDLGAYQFSSSGSRPNPPVITSIVVQ